MTKTLALCRAGTAILALIAIGCAAPPPPVAEPAAAAAADERDATPRVRLDPERTARAGIRTVAAERAEGVVAIAGFGRVLDPLPLVEGWHARAAVAAA